MQIYRFIYRNGNRCHFFQNLIQPKQRFCPIKPFVHQRNNVFRSYASNAALYKHVTSIRHHFLYKRLNVLHHIESRSLSGSDNQHVKSEKESKWLTVPNLLTAFRLFASPYIGYLVLQEDFQLALFLFCLAGVTDGVDGWIARNVKGQSSVIGSFIDPLADKVLISILTVTLTMVDIIPVVLCGMIVLRDVLLVTTSSHFHYKNLTPPKTLKKFFDFENSKVKMEPTEISKYNTFLQLGLVALSTAAPVLNFVDHPLLQAYWFLVGTTTVLSGLSYVIKDKSTYRIKP